MPNFDGGHYFLTVLAPIKAALRVDPDGRRRSPAHLIREELAFLPTAEQTKASAGHGGNSPFARVPRTHFARFFVLDDVIYNGRQPSDVLLGTLTRAAPLTSAQPVDRLAAKYLVFTAAFDAASGAPSELDAYLTTLWEEMQGQLIKLFGNCEGSDKVTTAEGFRAYIKKCQIETTLPFNDYWIAPPPLESLTLTSFLPAIGVFAAGVLIAVILAVLGVHWAIELAIVVVGVVVAVWWAYHTVMHAGATPFPTAPNSDLPSVLKALYLQRTFTAFAIDGQGDDDATLHRKFGEFLARDKPDDLTSATQPAGIIPGIEKP
jgi:hypothetical protein